MTFPLKALFVPLCQRYFNRFKIVFEINGKPLFLTKEKPLFSLKFFNTNDFITFLLDPEVRFGDFYCSGRLVLQGDLYNFLLTVLKEPIEGGPSTRLKTYLRNTRNTLYKSKLNAEAHYNLGNEFFGAWLDPSMTYTCAYFTDDDQNLEAAQEKKMEHICRKLRLLKGLRVVEAGSGWGCLAIYMARRYGVHVTAFNVSSEQVVYAKEQATRQGLQNQVHFVEDDYRNISGTYDRFVSVGMLEHVGKNHFMELANVVQCSLASNGYGLLHSITHPSDVQTSKWLQKRVFPGCHIPNLIDMVEVIESAGCTVWDVENLRFHYVKTLQHWFTNFKNYAHRVISEKGIEFYRMWELYLLGSKTSFQLGNSNLIQMSFAPKGNTNLPLERRHLYEGVCSPQKLNGVA